MGRDKALLSYDGRSTQLERSAQLLQSVCSRVFISQRAEQGFPLPPDTSAIDDAIDAIGGPLCGILSAMQAHPDAHWLILACDLPHVRSAPHTLVRHFGEQLYASPPTAARGRLVEPSPSPAGVADDLRDRRAAGQTRPRKLLIVRQAHLIEHRPQPRQHQHPRGLRNHRQRLRWTSTSSISPNRRTRRCLKSDKSPIRHRIACTVAGRDGFPHALAPFRSPSIISCPYIKLRCRTAMPSPRP